MEGIPRLCLCLVLILGFIRPSGGGDAPKPKHTGKAGPPPRRGGRERLLPFTVMAPAVLTAAAARGGESGRLRGEWQPARGGSHSVSSPREGRIDARNGDGEVPAEIPTGCVGEQPLPRRLAKKHRGREKLATRGIQVHDGASIAACQIQVFGRTRTRTSMQGRGKVGGELGERGSRVRRRHDEETTVVPRGCAVGDPERGTGIGMGRSCRRSMRESIKKKQWAPAKPESGQELSSRAKPKPKLKQKVKHRCDSGSGTDGNCPPSHLCQRGNGSEGEAGDNVHRADAIETSPKDSRGKEGSWRKERDCKASTDRSLSDRKWADRSLSDRKWAVSACIQANIPHNRTTPITKKAVSIYIPLCNCQSLRRTCLLALLMAWSVGILHFDHAGRGSIVIFM